MKRREPTSDESQRDKNRTTHDDDGAMRGSLSTPPLDPTYIDPRPSLSRAPLPSSNSIPPAHRSPSHARTVVCPPPVMPQRWTFEYNPLSYAYPDDESDKELFLQASGTIACHLRTVLLYWVNMVFNDGEQVWQVVRLDRREEDVHKYVYPDLIVVDGDEREEEDETFSLGMFSRDQREALLECAEEVEYDERSGEEGQCLRWMGRLLERMIEEGLVGRAVVDAIRDAVPLPSSRRR